MRYFYSFFLMIHFSLISHGSTLNFLNLRRRYHRHHCPHRRCLPLHSKVPFR
uniref:Apelin receptor early endogenous ligand n=1 Tax=Cynoglossus semilaevis TaxID=244447 RepID=A0A3P8UT63_CYNSE